MHKEVGLGPAAPKGAEPISFQNFLTKNNCFMENGNDWIWLELHSHMQIFWLLLEPCSFGLRVYNPLNLKSPYIHDPMGPF